MGRKVFISVLGTGPYKELSYRKDDFCSKKTKFIQIATLDYLTTMDIHPDVAVILLTEESEKKYWLDSEEGDGLEHCLKDYKNPIKLLPVCNIPNGENEGEINEIFSKAFNVLEDGDELYFDITHGFRYLPMLVMILINYSRFLKKTEMKSITYGMLVNRDTSEGKIIDMNSLYELERLTEASHGTMFGTMKDYIDVLPNSEADSAMYNFKNALIDIETAIATSDIKALKEGIPFLKLRNYRKLANSQFPNYNRQINDVISLTKDFVAEDSYKNVEVAIEWTFSHGMMSQAFTLAQEYVISLFADKIKPLSPYDKKNKSKLRKYFVGNILAITKEDADNEIFKGELKDYPDLSKKLLSLDGIWDLKEHYEILRSARNNLNHGNGVNLEGFKKSFDLYGLLKDKINNLDICLINP